MRHTGLWRHPTAHPSCLTLVGHVAFAPCGPAGVAGLTGVFRDATDGEDAAAEEVSAAAGAAEGSGHSSCAGHELYNLDQWSPALLLESHRPACVRCLPRSNTPDANY